MAGPSVSSPLADLLAARVADLITPENRDDFAAYLARLEARYLNDKAIPAPTPRLEVA